MSSDVRNKISLSAYQIFMDLRDMLCSPNRIRPGTDDIPIERVWPELQLHYVGGALNQVLLISDKPTSPNFTFFLLSGVRPFVGLPLDRCIGFADRTLLYHSYLVSRKDTSHTLLPTPRGIQLRRAASCRTRRKSFRRPRPLRTYPRETEPKTRSTISIPTQRPSTQTRTAGTLASLLPKDGGQQAGGFGIALAQ